MSDAFTTGEPHSALEIESELHRLQSAGETYLDGLPPVVFVQPQGPKWSPGDHVRHLAKSNFPVARALGQSKLVLLVLFGPQRRPSQSFTGIRETYQARLRQGADAGRFAPSAQPQPSDPNELRREVLGRWRKSVDLLGRQTTGWNDRQLDRYRIPHPLLGKLSVREMLFFTLYHNAHHLNLVAGRVTALKAPAPSPGPAQATTNLIKE